MARYDKERLLDEATAEEVAAYLGLEMVRRGSRIFIRCPSPGHNDRNIGNCCLTHKGYKCFACGASGGLIDLVMQSQNCDFTEALGLIGDALGGRQQYLLSGNDTVTKQYRPSKEVLTAAGFHIDSGTPTAISVNGIFADMQFVNTLINAGKEEIARRTTDMERRLNRITGADAPRIIQLFGNEHGCVPDTVWHELEEELRHRRLQTT